MTDLEKRLRELHFEECGCDGYDEARDVEVHMGCDVAETIREAARIGAEVEREACAQLADERAGFLAASPGMNDRFAEADFIRTAIRARGGQ